LAELERIKKEDSDFIIRNVITNTKSVASRVFAEGLIPPKLEDWEIRLHEIPDEIDLYYRLQT